MQEPFSSQLLDRLSTDIERHKRHVLSTPDRRARIGALEDMIKALDRVVRLTNNQSLAAAPAFSVSCLSRLGELLSCAGIEKLAGTVAWGVDERSVKDGFDRRGRGDVLFMDRLTQIKRHATAIEIGPTLLVRLLADLKGPLETALRIERADRGGRPAHIYRNYVLHELIAAHRDRTGALPSAAKTGPFIEACAEVLRHLDIETAGLEAALQRILTSFKG